MKISNNLLTPAEFIRRDIQIIDFSEYVIKDDWYKTLIRIKDFFNIAALRGNTGIEDGAAWIINYTPEDSEEFRKLLFIFAHLPSNIPFKLKLVPDGVRIMIDKEPQGNSLLTFTSKDDNETDK